MSTIPQPGSSPITPDEASKYLKQSFIGRFESRKIGPFSGMTSQEAKKAALEVLKQSSEPSSIEMGHKIANLPRDKQAAAKRTSQAATNAYSSASSPSDPLKDKALLKRLSQESGVNVQHLVDVVKNKYPNHTDRLCNLLNKYKALEETETVEDVSIPEAFNDNSKLVDDEPSPAPYNENSVIEEEHSPSTDSTTTIEKTDESQESVKSMTASEKEDRMDNLSAELITLDRALCRSGDFLIKDKNALEGSLSAFRRLGTSAVYMLVNLPLGTLRMASSPFIALAGLIAMPFCGTKILKLAATELGNGATNALASTVGCIGAAMGAVISPLSDQKLVHTATLRLMAASLTPAVLALSIYKYPPSKMKYSELLGKISSFGNVGARIRGGEKVSQFNPARDMAKAASFYAETHRIKLAEKNPDIIRFDRHKRDEELRKEGQK